MISHIDVEKCTGCGLCVSVCPLDTLRLDPFRKAQPPCRQRCPAGVDVRGFLFYVKQGMLKEASDYLKQFLPFPAITGLLCHHPCELACARKRVDQAVNVSGIEYYIGSSLFSEAKGHHPLTHAAKAAVIGSGPAGLSGAWFLRKMGFSTTVFESEEDLGGSLLKEVRVGHLPMDILDAQVTSMKDMGISFVNSCKLSEDMNIEDLRDKRYSAVFLATGSAAGLPDEIAIEGKKNVRIDPITFETNIKGVFAGGGLVDGNTSLVEVVASTRRAVLSIGRF